MSENTFTQILSEVSTFARSANDLASLQNFIVEIIPQRLSYYNWTGFYMLDPGDSDTLVLGSFRGAPTEHVRIPVSQGICGAAVAQNNTVIVDDVHSDPRYLACSLETRSEIVVPIRANNAVVGEIDIDSHGLAAFSAQDKDFLEKCGNCGRLYGTDSSRVFRSKIEVVVISAAWIELRSAQWARVAAVKVFADRQFVPAGSAENCPNVPL